jgi:hypothetical protein
VNSRESTAGKIKEVEHIMHCLGEWLGAEISDQLFAVAALGFRRGGLRGDQLQRLEHRHRELLATEGAHAAWLPIFYLAIDIVSGDEGKIAVIPKLGWRPDV